MVNMKRGKFFGGLQMLKRMLAASVLAAVLVLSLDAGKAFASDKEEVTARPSVDGQLSVEGTDIVNEKGEVVQLKGVSLHGITWFPDFINESLFNQVSVDWDANLIRVPVYSDVYPDSREDCLALTKKAIDAAVAADMYVIVDWHVLEDKDPNVCIDYARDFFNSIVPEYAGVPNILYEICNEPNGETTWTDVRDYAYYIIPTIRQYSPDSIIIVGTPNYCKDLNSPVRNPLKIDNVVYSLHFYAATHKEDLRREYESALSRGLPVFISECGLSEASGSGEVDYISASLWFSMINDNKTSYAVWSLSNKNETSALFAKYYDPSRTATDNDLSGAGTWTRDLLRGQDPRDIAIPSSAADTTRIPDWIMDPLSTENLEVARIWPKMALSGIIFIIVGEIIANIMITYRKKKYHTYADLFLDDDKSSRKIKAKKRLHVIVIILSIFVTLLYLGWRIWYSIPFKAGALAVAGNIVLLVVEIFGFLESMILYYNLMGMREYPKPEIADEEYPDVDIFIATYNEPADLLRKTINGCNHLKYPDKNKVHIWLCDDNRRPEMRKLAEDMHIGYFDRPDNKGAKAGNLNHALGLTNAPYVVTLDADMIPRSNFLLNTIPYFIDAKKRSEDLPEDKKIRLGLLQTPQCFYTPDVFQHALYAEKSAPNEQDFFYRTIEVARTSTNSVIYGGSNTILAREALDSIGGFFTETITEDFATGMLIESKGYVSLALPEPLASGMTPHTYKEHIQQRKRWGRGVISTAKQLHILRRRGLYFMQKLSYISSMVYWYSPIKSLIYIISPLMFAVFAIPVFKCGWLDLMIYWLPMFIMQDVCLRVFSGNAVSLKWSGIYETSVMPHLLIPVIKETFGIKATKFEVTDKAKRKTARKTDIRSMIPFIVLVALCVAGIIRSFYLLSRIRAMGVFVLLFWLFRNMYFLIMSLFLVDGRDSDNDEAEVIDAELIEVKRIDSEDGAVLEGITTYLTEHSMKVFFDEDSGLRIGENVDVYIQKDDMDVCRRCVVTGRKSSRSGGKSVYSLELINPLEDNEDYLQIIYDRIPSLPQSLVKDYGLTYHMLRNIAFRILRQDK